MGSLSTTKRMVGIAGFLFFGSSIIGISVGFLENPSIEVINMLGTIISILTLLASIFLILAGASGITKKSSNQS